MVLLENVSAFTRAHGGKILNWLVGRLSRDGGCVVTHQVLGTSAFGLPQTRKRWFLIALRADAIVADFSWPSAIALVPLFALLGPKTQEARQFDVLEVLLCWLLVMWTSR